MKPTAHAASTLAITLTLGLGSLVAGCGGDDTGGGAGAGGTAATGDASLDARGATGGASGSGGTAGVGGSGGTTGVADSGPASDGQGVSDAAAELPPPFMTQILYDFLPVDAGGNVLGWAATLTNAGATVIASDDQAPASPTGGSLEFRGIFPPLDANGFALMTAEVNFGDPTSTAGVRDFTGATTFHFWVRVVSPPGTLRALQPFVQAGSLYSYSGTYQPYVTNIDNDWHEYQVSVAGQTFLNGVWKLGIQFFAPQPPVSEAGVAEGGDDEVTEGGEGGDLDAVAGDAATAAADVDAAPPSDAQAVIAADADAGVAPDAEGGLTGDAGEQEGGEGGGSDAGSPIIVRIDYVWVN